jgi:hypothetical protein
MLPMKYFVLMALLLTACTRGPANVSVYIAEDDQQLRDAVQQRLETRIQGVVVNEKNNGGWVVEAPSDAALSDQLGTDGFALKSDAGQLMILGNTRRARLYGLWEAIERVKRGESVEALDMVEVPKYKIRGDTQNPHTPYKLSRQETLDFWEEYFDWAMWMRMNMFLPFQSNGRVVVPRGYPDYANHEYSTGGGYYAMKRIYELCELYGIDYYYPLHLYPVPAETGFRDEPTTSVEFFYPDGVEDRVPRIGPFVELEETKYHLKFPEYYNEHSEVNLSNPGLWNSIETEIEAAQELFPNMKGFFLNFAETNGHSQKFAVIRHQGNRWEILKKTFRFIKEKAPDKKLVLFHHGPGILVFNESGRLPQDIYTFFQQEMPEMMHVVDLHPGPQHPGQPVFGSVGPEPARRALCENLNTILWTICDGEHIGRTAIAYSVPGYIYNDMKQAMDYGVNGSFNRTGNYDFGRVPGTLLEINGYTAYRVLWNPDVSLDQLWNEWVGSRFGPELETAIRAILEPVETIVRKGLILHNCPMFGTMGMQDNENVMTGGLQNARSFAAGIRYPTILDLFQPAGTLMYPNVNYNRRDKRFLYNVQQKARPIQDIFSDRAEAVKLARDIHRQTETLQSRVSPEDYTLISDAVKNLRHLVEISALFTQALYYEKMAFIDNYDNVSEPIKKFEEALGNLETRAFEIRRQEGDFFFYGIPQAMGSYRQMGRLRLESAATRGYKMK